MSSIRRSVVSTTNIGLSVLRYKTFFFHSAYRRDLRLAGTVVAGPTVGKEILGPGASPIPMDLILAYLTQGGVRFGKSQCMKQRKFLQLPKIVPDGPLNIH